MPRQSSDSHKWTCVLYSAHSTLLFKIHFVHRIYWTITSLRAMVLKEEEGFCPLGTFGDIWRRTWLSQVCVCVGGGGVAGRGAGERRLVLASSGWRPEDAAEYPAMPWASPSCKEPLRLRNPALGAERES